MTFFQNIDFSNKKKLLSIISLIMIAVALPLTLALVKQRAVYKTEAASYEAKLWLVPSADSNPQGINIQPSGITDSAIRVFVNTGIGESGSANINTVELGVSFDPTKIELTDSNGTPLTVPIMPSGNIFDGKGPWLSPDHAVDSTLGKLIYSVVAFSGDYSGINGLVTEFWIKAKDGASGSTTLDFYEVQQDFKAEQMNVLQSNTGTDILSAALMNGQPSSSLVINIGNTSGPNFTLSTDNTAIQTGQDFDVDINIDTNGENIVGADLILKYDQSVFRIVTPGITEGNIFANYLDSGIPNPQNGIFEFSAWTGPDDSPPPPYNGIGLLAVVKFEAIAPAQDSLIYLDFNGSTDPQVMCTDTNMLTYLTQEANDCYDVLSAVNNLTLDVANGPTATPQPTNTPTTTPTTTPIPTTTPQPTATTSPNPTTTVAPPSTTPTETPPSPTPTPDESYCSDYRADINCDKHHDSFDLSALLSGWGTNFMSEPDFPFCSCTPSKNRRDINNDGKVNAADIQILISWWGLDVL